MAVTLYVKDGCPYCDRMREELDAALVEFHEFNISERPELIPELLKLSGGERKVPVLVDGVRIEVAPKGG